MTLANDTGDKEMSDKAFSIDIDGEFELGEIDLKDGIYNFQVSSARFDNNKKNLVLEFAINDNDNEKFNGKKLSKFISFKMTDDRNANTKRIDFARKFIRSLGMRDMTEFENASQWVMYIVEKFPLLECVVNASVATNEFQGMAYQNINFVRYVGERPEGWLSVLDDDVPF